MCGRYYVDDDTAREIEKLVRDIDEKMNEIKRKRDISPTQVSAVLCGQEESLALKEQYWGFPSPVFGNDKTAAKSSIIFNARAESALEKPMFKDSIRNRRIIVPARGFYEWDNSRTKYNFRRKDGKVLYMAGCYKKFEDKERFVILTTAANDSMSIVHDRMPLILEEKQIEEWVLDNKAVELMLRQKSPMLEKSTDYEQQTLELF